MARLCFGRDGGDCCIGATQSPGHAGSATLDAPLRVSRHTGRGQNDELYFDDLKAIHGSG